MFETTFRFFSSKCIKTKLERAGGNDSEFCVKLHYFSCWAMAAIEALTDRLCIFYAKLGIKFNPVLSYRQMLLCAPGHVCHGGSGRRVTKFNSKAALF